jgi:hypothetical protein
MYFIAFTVGTVPTVNVAEEEIISPGHLQICPPIKCS